MGGVGVAKGERRGGCNGFVRSYEEIRGIAKEHGISFMCLIFWFSMRDRYDN